MAEQIGNAVDLGELIYAEILEDGSLMLMTRVNINRAEEWRFREEVTIRPKGVKTLIDLLVRDAQLRIGADDAGQPCPSCGGDGINHDPSTTVIFCSMCNGSGQV